MSLRAVRTGHIENIGERGARRRRRGGFVWLAIGIVAWVTLLVRHVPANWAFLLVVPFTLAAVGFLQAREKT